PGIAIEFLTWALPQFFISRVDVQNARINQITDKENLINVIRDLPEPVFTFTQLRLDTLAVGDVADDGQHPFFAIRQHTAFVVAGFSIDGEGVVESLYLAGLDGSGMISLCLFDDIGGQDIGKVAVEKLLRRDHQPVWRRRMIIQKDPISVVQE